MNEYEILLLLDPELDDERQGDVVTRTRELVESGGGTWDLHDAWGRRKLAYEIDHKGEGSYHLLHFTCDAGDARRGVARAADRRRRHAPHGDTSDRGESRSARSGRGSEREDAVVASDVEAEEEEE